ncbi:MAG TPA: acetylglutamate kinase [Terriglobales bacterium]|nr:acetylglutamate kinase [Terriglobales bacterium]
MRVVVKIGGAALESKEVVKTFAQSIARLTRQGHQVVVVHGGGVALSRTLSELGRETKFVNGLRVTDSATRDVALMVLAGQLNKMLVAALTASGQPAIGLCGGDLGLFRAAKKNADLGYVGEICRVEPEWIERMWSHGAVPVVSSLALGVDGEYYNVNADQMASACAIACKANVLIFLTDVPGVKGSDGDVIRYLDITEIPSMISSAVISGGMLPKLEACTRALERGVPRVRIMPAAQVEVLPGFFTHYIQYGTEVVRQ